ncbi:MAG: NAD-dependent epimerase/dehydratase family protein, partial [Butyrivibrio sp.]|nr:NAD-dependent epimerase/dehydratase family protein [Butyrivibrio sp.]
IDTVDMIDGTWREKDFSGYDSVFHVAGIAHSDNGKISKEKEKLYYAVNTDLTVETAKKAKADGVKQFIFMSSAIVYGNSAPIGKGKRITKDTPVRPANCYGDSKVQAENGLRPLNDDNFKVVILRPPMIYGNGSKGNYPLMSKMAQKLPIFPYVKNRRSMLYIENLCEFVRLMIKNNEQGIFWPQNREYSNTSEMVKMIGEAHGKKVRLIRGFEWALKLLGLFTGLVDKAFGNLYYDKALSVYKQNYRVADLKWSVFLTEDTSDTRSVNKKKALMLASVASMIDQFNIPNIEILQSLGYEVDVVANFEEPGTITIERANDLKKKLAGMNANVTHVAIPRTLNPKAIFTAYRSVKRIINKGNYDLIHCHSPIGGAICRLAAIKARRKGTKVIYTAHGFHFYDGAPKKNWIVYYPVERVLSWVTDVLITINNEDFNRSKKEFHVKNVVKVPGVGVNTQKFRECDVNTREKRKLLGIPNDSFVLLSVGELQDRKNHRIVIEALHKINNSN